MKKENWFFLASFPGFTNRRKVQIAQELTEEEIAAEKFLCLPWITDAQREKWNAYVSESARVQEQFASMRERGIAFAAFPEPEYPAPLRTIYEPPFAVYYRGRLPFWELPAVSIVGARDCSSYGREMAEYFARTLAENGVSIISGLAYGIDAAAHRGALQAQGYTLGVLGCGADICYPKEHYYLYEHMIKTGGILSEFAPGTPPLPHHFPQRNRIISGLSQCILIMEAKQKSGSLITAEHALEQGKDVFALPGRIGDRLSEGCNRLIQSGAQLLREPEEVLEYLKNFCEFSVKEIKKSDLGLAEQEKFVYSCLDFTPKHIENLMEMTGLSFPVLAMVLLSLEQKGVAVKLSDGYFAAKARKDRN